MEQGVEPLARLIWAPHRGPDPSRLAQRSPLREPPITADPMALRQIEQSLRLPATDVAPLEAQPLPPDLPAPLVLQEGQALPPNSSEPAPASQPTEGPVPVGTTPTPVTGNSGTPLQSPASSTSQAAGSSSSVPVPPQLPPLTP